ncbi:uncharacterized protein LOC129742405 [Uranotaenia lowii]|uniref:uncharacterized protein LOC129742405 n=1 Tax=Uranotaenia lowii TaxID=190385 RepID=UPI0024788813|nr:uncharacterized protein LOC129742405 [Uranotaenia lowii]
MADETFFTPGTVDLIIGCEAFGEFHSGKKISLGEDLPWLLETSFGWTVSGPAACRPTCIPRVCQLSTVDERLETALQKFWEIETIPMEHAHSSDESYCEEFYTETTTRDDDTGRYIVRLPRTNKPEIELGSSRSIAERRFLGLERRLQRDPGTKEAYHRFMAEYEELGHMRKLKEPVDDQISHCYLPHHPVFKASSTTTKTRVVG